jgi:hypothetical protein
VVLFSGSMRAPALLLIFGSLIFGFGASIGVPGVFMLRDAQARLELLQRRMLYWRFSQPLYVIGPLIAAVGVILLGRSADDDTAAAVWLLAGSLMLAGVAAWAIDCLLRGLRPVEFVFGRLPGWPFVVYVLATIPGIALLAGGFAAAGYTGWLFWPMIVVDLGFLAFYVSTHDIPPFFFYTLLLVIGFVVLLDPAT